MDALKLQYAKIVHSGPKHKFCIFYVLKVSEYSETLPNIILGPME
jgi:hypothetical protein